MKKFVFMVLFTGLLLSVAAQSKDEMQVRKVLQLQLTAWNNGDINSFMSGYWKNDSLMFIGKSGITYGWQKTLENYKKGYPDTATMGKLDFNILQVRRISSDHFFVVGKWHLARSIGDAGGHFTLLFRRIKSNWMIVADHSS